MGAVRQSNSHTTRDSHEDHFDTGSGGQEASRKGSVRSNLSIDDEDGKERRRSFSFLRRGSSKRKSKKDLNETKNLESQDQMSQQMAHLKPELQITRASSRSPSPTRIDEESLPKSGHHGRSPSTRSRLHSPRPSDVGFAEAVSDVVDIVKYETSRKGRARQKLLGDEFYSYGSPLLGRSPSRRRHASRRRSRSPWRGPPPTATTTEPANRSRSISPEYRTTCLDRRSRSPSPHGHPSHATSHGSGHSQATPASGQTDNYYGTTKLAERSRSPSPQSAASLPIQKLRTAAAVVGAATATLNRSRTGRRLPATPFKPSPLCLAGSQSVEGINFPTLSHSPTIPMLDKSPNNINFPRVNASPTRNTKHGSSNILIGGESAQQQATQSLLQQQQQQQQQPPYLSPETDPPLTFEAAASLHGQVGTGSRLLPSPLPNGYGKLSSSHTRPLQPPPLPSRAATSLGGIGLVSGLTSTSGRGPPPPIPLAPSSAIPMGACLPSSATLHHHLHQQLNPSTLPSLPRPTSAAANLPIRARPPPPPPPTQLQPPSIPPPPPPSTAVGLLMTSGTPKPSSVVPIALPPSPSGQPPIILPHGPLVTAPSPHRPIDEEDDDWC